LKIIITVAMVLTALVSPTYAAQVVFNFDPRAGNNQMLGTSESSTSGGIQITAYGDKGGIITGSATTPQNMYEYNPYGLGICNVGGSGEDCTQYTDKNSTDIQKDEMIRMDFSLVAQELAAMPGHPVFDSVTFDIYVVQPNSGDDLRIFAANIAPPLTGGFLNDVHPASLQTTQLLHSGPLEYIFTTLYNNYFVAVDCTTGPGGVDITSITLDYHTPAVPEPMTFLLTGTALLGLGFVMKRKTR
jgi:hypothetical protein